LAHSAFITLPDKVISAYVLQTFKAACKLLAMLQATQLQKQSQRYLARFAAVGVRWRQQHGRCRM